MPNQIVHWVGENPSIHTSSNGVVFDEILNYGYDVQPGGYTQVVTDVKKFGDSSFLIGTDSSWNGQRTRLQTAANTTLVGATDDFITSFWWKPTTDTFYAAPYYKGIVANGGHFIRTANGYDRSITDFRLEWFGPYHTAGVLAGFELDLTGLPWLNFLSTRENGVLTLAITDENGNTFNDRHGNPCLATINAAGHASTNAMFQLGGVGGYYNTMGYYDDIVFVSGQSVDYSASLASNGSSFWLSEMSISGEPFVTAVVSNASAGQSDGSVTVTDSNFSGTKTYTFYDSDLNILQQGISNTLNGLQANSYTIQVSDTNNNQVSIQFIISEGGNNMPSLKTNPVVVLHSHLADASIAGAMKVTDAAEAKTIDQALVDIRAAGSADATALVAAEEAAREAADLSLQVRLGVEEAALAAEIAATAANFAGVGSSMAANESARDSAIAAAKVVADAALATEASTARAAEGSLETRLGVDEAALATLNGDMNNGFNSISDEIILNESTRDSEIAAAKVVADAALATEASTARAAEGSLETRLGVEEAALAAEIAATATNFAGVGSSMAANESARDASIAAAKVVADAALAAHAAANAADFVLDRAHMDDMKAGADVGGFAMLRIEGADGKDYGLTVNAAGDLQIAQV